MAKLVPATCPKCGANVQLDPDREYVTCTFCGASSFVETQQRPVTQYVQQHAMPVIHLPQAVGILSGCSGAVAIIAGLLGVGAAIVGCVVAYVVASGSTGATPPSFVPSPSPGVAAPAEPQAELVEEDYFANPTLAKAHYEQVLGKPILGRFEGVLAGHGLNNAVVRALLSQPRAWRLRTHAPELAEAV